MKLLFALKCLLIASIAFDKRNYPYNVENVEKIKFNENEAEIFIKEWYEKNEAKKIENLYGLFYNLIEKDILLLHDKTEKSNLLHFLKNSEVRNKKISSIIDFIINEEKADVFIIIFIGYLNRYYNNINIHFDEIIENIIESQAHYKKTNEYIFY